MYGGILFCQCSLDHNGAFQTLLLHLTGEIEGSAHCPYTASCWRWQPAAAVELGPAVLALGLVIYSGPGEVILHLLVDGEIEYIAHLPLLMTNELMAGIYITIGSDGYIFIAAAAASQALDGAGTLIQIDHEVIEVKALAGLLLFRS